MTIADALRQYLNDSGETMRGLSLRAGLKEKAVSDILRLKGLRPQYKTIHALTQATGIDLVKCQRDQPSTYQELIDQLKAKGKTREANRILWLCVSLSWQ